MAENPEAHPLWYGVLVSLLAAVWGWIVIGIWVGNVRYHETKAFELAHPGMGTNGTVAEYPVKVAVMIVLGVICSAIVVGVMVARSGTFPSPTTPTATG